MIRIFGLSAVLAILALPGIAQEDSAQVAKPKRLSSHYIGLQANQLVKQLLNLGGSSSAINNPYLITYSVNSNATGVGLNLSLGYTADETLSVSGDGASQVVTSLKQLFFRIGIEKKTYIGKRWMLAAGGDLVVDNESNKIESKSNSGGSPLVSVNQEKSNALGAGVRVALNFHISDRVLLGTEATYYLKFVSVENSSQFPFGTPQKETEDLTRFQFNVPAVLFLSVKL